MHWNAQAVFILNCHSAKVFLSQDLRNLKALIMSASRGCTWDLVFADSQVTVMSSEV